MKCDSQWGCSNDAVIWLECYYQKLSLCSDHIRNFVKIGEEYPPFHKVPKEEVLIRMALE